MTLAARTRLGPYEVLTPLGAGGMGEVYKARDTRLDRFVAIKVLPQGFSESPQALERFQREARAAATLNHPNICTIYDVGVGDVPFIAMELLEGETLQQRLTRGAIEAGAVVQFGAALADALGAAHATGIIHRDIKPGNIFLTARGPKILDFGLAIAIPVDCPERTDSHASTLSGLELTNPGSTLGTIAYMSPEQARGELVTPHSDLFSLGAVLYEMATGRPAFAAQTTAVIFDAILNRSPAVPSSINRDVPAQLERIITRLLAKDPAGRWPTAHDLRDALQALQQPGAPAHREAGGSSKALPSIAVLPFVNMSAEIDSQYFSDGLAEELINALTRLPGLNVASRTSAFRFRGGDHDIREVARQLSVETVLEGSIRRAGKRLRITAQLIKAADGYHLWSERYDREMADVFEIQDEIVTSIVKALAPALLGHAKKAVRPTDNLEAYELYLKGRHLWHQASPGKVHTAIQCFEQVIAIDPDYALAYAGLADCYGILRVNGRSPADSMRPRARAAVERAMTLAPGDPEVLCSQGIFTFYFDPAWHPAEGYFRQALTINPRFSMARAYLGLFLSCDCRTAEAIAQVEGACGIDPLSPSMHFIAAIVFNIARHFEKAERAARRLLELEPDSLMGLRTLGTALCGLERFDEAIPAFERVTTISKAINFLGFLGLGYGLVGRTGEAQQLLLELGERGRRGEYVPPYVPLCVQVGLGDVHGIRASLDACVTDQTPLLSILTLCGPWLERFRGDMQIDQALNRLYDGAHPPTA